ncbi:unnamed protein product [Clonostachys rosea f. rosea IK726]|uniref:Uncharacterized protein n=1 Tax=Clonostachys rosea f. rosea IK726 TaxID=1349383 RepID=A0ACA9TFD8_BIOOC|nr:unnamed protein product [Clonostachys rosea f. rosea IK726]
MCGRGEPRRTRFGRRIIYLGKRHCFWRRGGRALS